MIIFRLKYENIYGAKKEKRKKETSKLDEKKLCK